MSDYVEELKKFRIKFMNECRKSNFYLKKMILLDQENDDPTETEGNFKTPSLDLLDMEDSRPEDFPMAEPAFTRSASDIERPRSNISGKFNHQ